MADQRTALGRKLTENQQYHRTATQRFQADLKEDRICRARKTGEDIDSLVQNDQLQEARSKIKRWYREAKGHQSPPTSEGLEQTLTLREDIYRQLPLEGEPLPILVQPVSISDGPPYGEEIAASVRKLRMVRAGGATGVDQGERCRHREVGKISEYNASSALGQIHPRGNGMENDGTHTEGWMRVQ